MNPHRSIARFAATVLVTVAYVALSAASVGCGGGNDSSGSTTTTVVAVFTPDTATPADGSITLLPGTTSGASVNVRVTVTQVASFFGAAFRIKYDVTALQFNAMSSTDSFLRGDPPNPDDPNVYFAADASHPGEIWISATRLDPTAGTVDVVSTSDLVVLNFTARKAIAAGAAAGRVVFGALNREVQTCDGTVVPTVCSALAAIWSGGGVSAQQ